MLRRRLVSIMSKRKGKTSEMRALERTETDSQTVKNVPQWSLQILADLPRHQPSIQRSNMHQPCFDSGRCEVNEAGRDVLPFGQRTS